MPRWWHFIVFISVVVAVYGGMHYYVYRRFLAAVGPFPRVRLWVTRLFIVGMVAGFFLIRFLRRENPGGVVITLHWISVLWLGFFFYVFLLTLLAHGVTTIAGALGLRRWSFLGPRPGVAGVIAILATACLISGYAFLEAHGPPTTTELEIPVKDLPSGMDGFTVVQVSDVHLGLTNGQACLRRVIQHVNVLEPDLVVITGDLADERSADLGALIPMLRGIRSRHGILSVTGNHEGYAGAEGVIRYAQAAGVRYLRNEGVRVGAGLQVYGLDGHSLVPQGGESVSLGSVVGPEARTGPALLLSHQAVDLDQARALGIDLVLSGHTHRGQLWPFHLIIRLFHRRLSGLFQSGDSYLYISRGAGTWGPPMRLGAPPEVVRIRLRPRHSG